MVHDELKNMSKEAVVAYLKVLIQNFLGRLKKSVKRSANVVYHRSQIRACELQNTKQHG